ncbi:ferredoxin [Prauserella sediminis]|uniref:Ferredoxin n=1 Tax=Prauserella sediminis TaxID=577680 RepID=A0A839XVU7_9PSEU|nr:ferredoxin [Prauserella sediminis]MBB3665504.1 ferredoxin [Prauserella sediminis]
MARKIDVDRDLCMGSGQCVFYAPRTFDQDETTVAIVTNADGDSSVNIRTAVEACPTQALSFDEDGD